MIEEGEEKKKKENTGKVNPFSNNWRNKESHNTVKNKPYLNSLRKHEFWSLYRYLKHLYSGWYDDLLYKDRQFVFIPKLF